MERGAQFHILKLTEKEYIMMESKQDLFMKWGPGPYHQTVLEEYVILGYESIYVDINPGTALRILLTADAWSHSLD